MSKYDAAYWQRMIDEIMDCFDFAKVHTCMVALDWQWVGRGVPEELEIRQRARQLLRECVERNIGGTGGFEVSIDREEGVLTLIFAVDHWDAYGEER